MSLKRQIAWMQKTLQAIKPRPDCGSPPPERSQFMKNDGVIDSSAWLAAVDEWSMKTFGKPLKEVAEKIAEEEGF